MEDTIMISTANLIRAIKNDDEAECPVFGHCDHRPDGDGVRLA